MKPPFIERTPNPYTASNIDVNDKPVTEFHTNEQSSEWLNKNRTALESYNKRITKRGVFSDKYRTF